MFRSSSKRKMHSCFKSFSWPASMSWKSSVARTNRDLGLEFGNTFKNRQSKITQVGFPTNLRKTRTEDNYEMWIYRCFGQVTYNKQGVKSLHWLTIGKNYYVKYWWRLWRLGYQRRLEWKKNSDSDELVVVGGQ